MPRARTTWATTLRPRSTAALSSHALRRSRAARLVWTPLFKRSPSASRLALVPAEETRRARRSSARALADFRRLRRRSRGARPRAASPLCSARPGRRVLAARLGLQLRLAGPRLSSPRRATRPRPRLRRRAHVEGRARSRDEAYLRTARSSCDFILKDLPRSHETERRSAGAIRPARTRLQREPARAETLAAVVVLTG